VEQTHQITSSPKAEREAALLAHFTAAGFARAEPAVLQPAAVFLDLSGEDIRSRIFLTQDRAGEEFCLRPEYTIPVCREYLASTCAREPASFAYLGPVFRQRARGPAEFHQAGIESFGRADREAADAEILTLAIEAVAAAGVATGTVTMGDAGLLNALLEGMDIDRLWLRRIRRAIVRHQPLDVIFAAPEVAANGGGQSDYSGLLTALEGVDRRDAQALVEDLLSIAGITSVSGRSASDIAERFLGQAALRNAPQFSSEKRRIIEAYLAISGDLDAASAQLRALAGAAGLDLSQALDEFDARTGFIAARGFDLDRLHFSAGFARNLEYYTGFVFEAFAAGVNDGPVVGGGRYDGVLKALGADTDIAAVGAAIWCDRIDASAGAAS